MTATRELRIRGPETLLVIGIYGNPLGENSGLPTINQCPSRQGITATSEVLAQFWELGIRRVVRYGGSGRFGDRKSTVRRRAKK